jgi:mannose-6-phosphate isomerase-like protein (cupin superfamily)
MEIRRIVTGYDDSGSPAVLWDGAAPAVVELPAEVGASLVDLWRSDTLPLGTVGADDPTTAAPFALMPRGSLFRIIDLAPGEHAPLWHTTASVDFVYVATGVVTLLYGSPEHSEEVTVASGGTIVQRGLHHAWVNRGTDPCRLVDVSVAATLPDGIEPG